MPPFDVPCRSVSGVTGTGDACSGKLHGCAGDTFGARERVCVKALRAFG